jgi:radical SAM superfamily enzyme YgiQ (UPF0313 family)
MRAEVGLPSASGAVALGLAATTRPPVRVVLIGTYDLGHQSFGLASPAAWLREAGVQVTCLDLSRQGLDAVAVGEADLVAFHVPMHTATRLALRALPQVRALNPRASICFYGLYAVANEAHLRSLGVTVILGGEFEQQLTMLANDLGQPGAEIARTAVSFDRLRFLVPDRSGLPPLADYAAVAIGTERRVAGYTEASRGCKHRCRHCPVVPVYDGRLRIVQREVVLDDIAAQVDAGAQHITFGDPDFFNAFTHSMAVVQEMHDRHPHLTYDVTIKVEHLLKHRDHLARLRDTGCLWITAAVESVDDEVLRLLDKGHTRADFIAAVHLLRSLGLALSPTFVMFHPWLSVSRFIDTLALLQELDLVETVAPVQLTTRLLIPSGSLLLELAEVRSLVDDFDPESLAHPWRHPDPRVDDLHRKVGQIVAEGEKRGAARGEIFEQVWETAVMRRAAPVPDGAAVPYLLEPWYC